MHVSKEISRMFSIPRQHACIPSTTRKIQIVQIAPKTWPILPTLIVNMVGRSYSVNGYTLAYNRNYGMKCRISRFHNIFGPEGTWNEDEKKRAAICRKITSTPNDETIDISGNSKQTRSFLYIDECMRRNAPTDAVGFGTTSEYRLDRDGQH